MKALYAEKYKALIKDVEDDSQKWKDTPCSSVLVYLAILHSWWDLSSLTRN